MNTKEERKYIRRTGRKQINKTQYKPLKTYKMKTVLESMSPLQNNKSILNFTFYDYPLIKSQGRKRRTNIIRKLSYKKAFIVVRNRHSQINIKLNVIRHKANIILAVIAQLVLKQVEHLTSTRSFIKNEAAHPRLTTPPPSKAPPPSRSTMASTPTCPPSPTSDRRPPSPLILKIAFPLPPYALRHNNS